MDKVINKLWQPLTWRFNGDPIAVFHPYNRGYRMAFLCPDGHPGVCLYGSTSVTHDFNAFITHYDEGLITHHMLLKLSMDTWMELRHMTTAAEDLLKAASECHLAGMSEHHKSLNQMSEDIENRLADKIRSLGLLD